MRILLLLFLFVFDQLSAQEYYLLVGTYTTGASKGIYTFKVNLSTGDATEVAATAASNPSYLAVDRDRNRVYAVSEMPGTVNAYAFDTASGKLTLLNSQSSEGRGPCYVSIDARSRWVMVGNYGGGNLSALKVNDDGTLSKAAQTINHSGSGGNRQRQEASHVHATVFSRDQECLFVPDLGIDKVMIYQFKPDSEKPLAPARQPFINLSPGTGPRHLTEHPSRPFLYIMNELSGSVTAVRRSGSKFSVIQTISSHPENFSGQKGSADIHVTPDGKFLYASNRGSANSLAMFSIDQLTGKLTSIGFQSTLGERPRNFVIDPTGNYLLAANQETGNIVIFRIDPQSGLLKPQEKQIQVPSPVCLKLIPR